MRGAEEGLSVVAGGKGAQQERPVWRHRFEIRHDTGEPMDRGQCHSTYIASAVRARASLLTATPGGLKCGVGMRFWTHGHALRHASFNRSGALRMKFTKAEIDAIIEASPRTFVPFNKLVLSQDYQARAGASTPKMSIAELAASIKECGVLQNLVVVQGARGRYEVCAGGRRLEALTLLVGSGDLADNYPVPVLIVPADRALIASLSENCFHIPLHPADEFAAFAKLIGQGKSVEDVAAAFGVTPLVVKRRMKLATVSPKLMTLFREDQIGLDCLIVLASVDDHQKQEQTWAALPSWNRRPDYLRQLLTQGEIESDRDAVAKYVTLKAYEKAGGALRRDLFSDDDKKVYLLDAALLEKLATDKLQKRAKQIAAEGWKWVDVRVRYAFDEYVKYGELRKTKRQPDAEEAAALEDLDGRIAALHAQMERLADEDGDEETFYRLEGEAEGLEEQRKARDEALNVWPADLMAQAGCVVHIGHNGAVAVKYGLIRPDDRSDMLQAARHAAENGTDETLMSLPSAKTRPVHSEKTTSDSVSKHALAIALSVFSTINSSPKTLIKCLVLPVTRIRCGFKEVNRMVSPIKYRHNPEFVVITTA